MIVGIRMDASLILPQTQTAPFKLLLFGNGKDAFLQQLFYYFDSKMLR